MYETILIPTDGSEGAGRGARHGLDIARQYGAAVHVLHVVDERTHGQAPALGSDELAFEKWQEEGEALVAEIADEARDAGLEVVTECVRGVPSDAIRAYADEHGVDLIVMGLHGTSGLGRPHIGSTTDRVVRTARVPVLPV